MENTNYFVTPCTLPIWDEDILLIQLTKLVNAPSTTSTLASQSEYTLSTVRAVGAERADCVVADGRVRSDGC